MKNLLILLALCTFGLVNAQGTIQINNFTNHTLRFQLVAEPTTDDEACDFILLGWDESQVGYEYIFKLEPNNTVTYTSYASTPSQIPSIPQWRRTPPGTTYPAAVANIIFPTNTRWISLKFDLVDTSGTVLISDTVSLPTDCNLDPTFSDGGVATAEIFTLGGITYFVIF